MTEEEMRELMYKVEEVEYILDMYQDFFYEEYPRCKGDKRDLYISFALSAEKYNSLIFAAQSMLSFIQADLSYYFEGMKFDKQEEVLSNT